MNLIDLWIREALDLFSGTGRSLLRYYQEAADRLLLSKKNHAHASFFGKVGRELKYEGLNLICGDAFRFINTAKPEHLILYLQIPPMLYPSGADSSINFGK
jgi:hypothetical protein